jgi:hypothetical protein
MSSDACVPCVCSAGASYLYSAFPAQYVMLPYCIYIISADLNADITLGVLIPFQK